jgi:phosphoenolpyruvate carboxylase
VLIPHSKEVRRKSTIDRKLEVAELLAARGRPFLTAAELRANEMAFAASGPDPVTEQSAAPNARSRGRQRRGARRRPPLDGFGFHLAALDLRQNSDAHERAVGEKFGLVQPGVDYATFTEPERIQ